MNLNKFFKISLLFVFLPFIFLSCGGPDGKFKLPGGDARKFPADPKERVKKNLEEGRGFTMMDAFSDKGKGGSGNFDFASSNELWRASLDTIDFMPLVSANYSGGIIITDWYSSGSNVNESIKISIRFLTNEIRSDALDIKVFHKNCGENDNCQVSQKTGSLFWVINKTKTALGARELKQWLLHPLLSLEAINDRYDGVDYLKNDVLTREELREQLHLVYDCERLLTRIVSHTNNPRDVIALKESLLACCELGSILQDASASLLNDSSNFFSELTQENHPIRKLISIIDDALITPAPTTISNGNIINPGYNEELDNLMQSFKDIKDWIGGLEAKEQERTGIKTLRVGFNKVFGYYFQVSKGQTDHVPDDYIRKQTLTNAERYITPELKEKETVLLHGEEKQTQLEETIYRRIIEEIITHTERIQQCAFHIARLDCLQSLATIAQQLNYIRPVLSDKDTELSLIDSRHPVLEKQHPHSLISNTITFDEKTHMLLITGPNMAGKSTLMKQVALSLIMAQMGSFVPASHATIGLADRCFTRIGASDNLSHGQSTFMVEMTETATIINNASTKSLIILDEIGRGTSTYDGMSIAAAVIHYIHNQLDRLHFHVHLFQVCSCLPVYFLFFQGEHLLNNE